MDADIPVRRHFRVLRRSLRLIVAFALLGLLVAVAVNALSPRRYESTATILVGPVLSEAQPGIDELIAAQRVAATYAQLASTPLVLDAVRTQLAITEPLDDFRERLIAQAAAESLFIEITFEDADPNHAAQVANAMAEGLLAAAPAVAPVDGETGAPQLRIVGRAGPAAEPSSPRVLLNILAGIATGLLAGLVLSYLRAYLRDDLDDPDEAVDLAGVPSLGRIGPDQTGDAVNAVSLARIAKRLELVDGGPSRLLLARTGTSDAGWLGEEIADHFAMLGRSTLLLRLDAAGRVAGEAATRGFERLLTDSGVQAQKLVVQGTEPSLREMYSGPGVEAAAESATRERMTAAMAALSGLADVVLLVGDPPTESMASLAVAPEATSVVLVIDPERDRRRDVASSASVLRSVGARLVGLVLLEHVRPGQFDERPTRARSTPSLAADRPSS